MTSCTYTAYSVQFPLIYRRTGNFTDIVVGLIPQKYCHCTACWLQLLD